MNDTMKDWNRTLKLNAAALNLAPALYYARCQVFDPLGDTWEDMAAHLRKAYLDMAHNLLQQMAPTKAVTFAKENNRPIPRLVPRDSDVMDDPFVIPEKPACVQCGTRDQNRHYAPYCSALCEQWAASRADGVEGHRR